MVFTCSDILANSSSVCSRLFLNNGLGGVVSLIISLLSIVLYDIHNIMALQRAMAFWPFFILGYCCKRKMPVEQLRQGNKFISFLVLGTGSLLALTISPYFTGLADCLSLKVCIGRVCSLIVAAMIGFGILTLFPSRVSDFAKQGQDVLFFYAFHIFILMATGLLVRMYEVSESLLMIVLVEFSVVLILHYLSKIKVLRKIVSL